MIELALLAVVAYAGYKVWTGRGFPVVPGHMYVITYKCTGQAGAPTVAKAQTALDTSAPQLWTVYTTQPSTVPSSFTLNASYDGPGNATVTASSLSSALPGCTASTVQDMGAPTPAQVAALTSGTVIPPAGA